MSMNAGRNEELTRTAKGSRMGELLRRYWHPVAAVGELEDNPVKPIRILGEDLVLYRCEDGTYGLLDRHCAHRRADLSYGYVDNCSLRCSYHGWAYDSTGSCTSAPYEDMVGNTFPRERVRLISYRIEALAGLLFAYLGPEPVPLLPHWELFDYEDGFCQVVLAPVPCNWLQCAENDIDPVHNEWLHKNWSCVQAGKNERAPTHVGIEVNEWEYGFAYGRTVEGEERANPYILAGYGRMHMMPNIFMPIGNHLEYRVPVDEHNTLSVVWSYEAVPQEMRPFRQEVIPHWYAQTAEPESGRWITTHVINQDTVAWAGQGRIADRENEHLGRSDRGVVMFRRQLLADMQKVERGEDPTGIIRDLEKSKVIEFPDDRRSMLTKGLSREEWRMGRTRPKQGGLLTSSEYFPFYAGQPAHVRAQYEEAMGLRV